MSASPRTNQIVTLDAIALDVPLSGAGNLLVKPAEFLNEASYQTRPGAKKLVG